jgi:hypothetical protein
MRATSIVSIMLFAVPASADAPRGSSYAEDVRETEAPAPVYSLVGESESDANLRIERLPTRLTMRPKPLKQTAQAGTTPAAAEPADSGGSVSTDYKRFPTSARDLRERVTFRIRAGVEIDTAAANGDAQRGGLLLPGDFADRRSWIMGDAIIGARGIVMPTLNGYLLSSFAFDAEGGFPDKSATVMPYDSQELVIKAGYAEWGRDDRKPDDQQPYSVWLRGGRQFRLDGGNMFAYYDGLTVGYKTKDTSLSAFAGRRVALFVETQAGLLFGATAALNLKPIKTRVNIDYMGLNLCIGSGVDDGMGLIASRFCGDDPDDLTDDAFVDVRATRHLVSATTSTKLGRTMKFDTRVRLTGLEDVDATGAAATVFALGRLSARLRYETNTFVVLTDVEQRFGDDVAYDLASPVSADVADIGNRIGILNTPIDSTSFGIRADWLNKKKTGEVLAFARAELPNETPVFADQRAYVEGGAGLAGSPIGVRGQGVYTTAQYTYRQYTDEGIENGMRIDGECLDFTDLDMDGLPDNCKTFGDSSSSGIDRMHQLVGEAALASRSGANRRWRFGAAGFFRVFDFRTPYREVKNDARIGGRLDLMLWLNRDFHLDIAAEFAQPSPTLAREIGFMSAIRAALEARW